MYVVESWPIAIFVPPRPLVATTNMLVSMHVIDAHYHVGEAEAGTRDRVVPVTDFRKVPGQFIIIMDFRIQKNDCSRSL